MSYSHSTPLAGILLVLGAAQCLAAVKVDFRPDFAPDTAARAVLVRAAESRVLQVTAELRRRTDCRLDPARDDLHMTIGYAADADSSILPAFYTFPDSMLRIIPDYLSEGDSDACDRVLGRYLHLEAPAAEIVARCSAGQRKAIPQIISRFLLSEMMHECYHDWQNRQARFPAVEQGKSILNRNRGQVGTGWRDFLRSRGVDLREHDRQMLKAELECCTLQADYWRSLYGPDPIHPLARSILHLMDASVSHYRDRIEAVPR